MRPKITRASSQEHLASRRFPTPIPDLRAAGAATVINGANSADAAVERMLTSSEASRILRLSESWLAKARMRGDGPPYAKMGRSIRYPERTLLRWVKSQLQSTSERQP
jgi:hypothetical protein